MVFQLAADRTVAQNLQLRKRVGLDAGQRFEEQIDGLQGDQPTKIDEPSRAIAAILFLEGRPELQIDAVFDHLDHLAPRPRRQGAAGPLIGDQQNRGPELSRRQAVHQVRGLSRELRRQRAGAFGEGRRIRHVPVHRADDDRRSQAVQERRLAWRDRDRLMDDIDAMLGDQPTRQFSSGPLSVQPARITEREIRDARGKKPTQSPGEPVQPGVGHEVHPIGFIGQQAGQLRARPRMDHQPRLDAAAAEKPKVMPGENRLPTKLHRSVLADDQDAWRRLGLAVGRLFDQLGCFGHVDFFLMDR